MGDGESRQSLNLWRWAHGVAGLSRNENDDRHRAQDRAKGGGMGWIDALPWKNLIKKIWVALAFDSKGRSRERAIIMVGALIITVFLYVWAVESINPSGNLFRLSWMSFSKPEHTIASGREGGWYHELSTTVEQGLDERGAFDVEVDAVGGSSAILKTVIEKPLAVGIVQEDVLERNASNGSSIRVVAPLYNERLHIVYRWSKIQAIAAADPEACEEFASLSEQPCGLAITLSENPSCATAKLFSESEVRLGSKGRPVGHLNTSQRVLALAGLQPFEENFELSISQAIDHLNQKVLDVALITSGAPISSLEATLDEGPDSDLCLAGVDARFTRLLNEIHGTDYRFSGFARIYPERFNQVSTFQVNAILIANKKVSRSFVGSVVEVLSEKKEKTLDDDYYPLEDFDEIDNLASTYPSKRFELLQAGVFFGLFCLVVWSVLIFLATWIVSSFKEAIYVRRLQRVYEELPSHVKLEQEDDGIPLPVIDTDSKEVVTRIAGGISSLLNLAMDIRIDYETGGITSSHHQHLLQSVYDVKSIFMRHLAQRLHSMIDDGDEGVTTTELTTFYTAGYLRREDFCFLSCASAPEDQGQGAPGQA
jgi:TRAP-type uncharacterized transport system substrate-binding protein